MLVNNYQIFSLSFNSADACSYGIPLPRCSLSHRSSSSVQPYHSYIPATYFISAVAMTTVYTAAPTLAVEREVSLSTSLFRHCARLVLRTSTPSHTVRTAFSLVHIPSL